MLLLFQDLLLITRPRPEDESCHVVVPSISVVVDNIQPEEGGRPEDECLYPNPDGVYGVSPLRF